MRLCNLFVCLLLSICPSIHGDGEPERYIVTWKPDAPTEQLTRTVCGSRAQQKKVGEGSSQDCSAEYKRLGSGFAGLCVCRHDGAIEKR